MCDVRWQFDQQQFGCCPYYGVTMYVSYATMWLADYPAMSFFFVCWHSRKWWPPIRGGTLQMLVLWPEKLNQIDSFCKSVILYASGGPRSIERCKKHGAPLRKTVFPRPICHFLSLSWKVAATNQDKLSLAWNVAATKRDKSEGYLWSECTFISSILTWQFHRLWARKVAP